MIQSPETKRARIPQSEVIDVDAEIPDTPPARQLDIPANIEFLDDDVEEGDVFEHGGQL